MSKTIRISDEVYQELDEIREKRETFSEAVGRIIKVYATIRDVSVTLTSGTLTSVHQQARQVDDNKR